LAGATIPSGRRPRQYLRSHSLLKAKLKRFLFSNFLKELALMILLKNAILPENHLSGDFIPDLGG
jgi:hypothetical protein